MVFNDVSTLHHYASSDGFFLVDHQLVDVDCTSLCSIFQHMPAISHQIIHWMQSRNFKNWPLLHFTKKNTYGTLIHFNETSSNTIFSFYVVHCTSKNISYQQQYQHNIKLLSQKINSTSQQQPCSCCLQKLAQNLSEITCLPAHIHIN